ncbi:MAG: GYD domain-containing protein, partial [Mycobacterium sp.]
AGSSRPRVRVTASKTPKLGHLELLNPSCKPWTPHQQAGNFNRPQCCRFRLFRAAVFGHDSQYLLEASYTLDGIKAVKSGGGSARVAAATELIESVGGKLESFYFAFGKTDAYVVADFPDNEAAAAAESLSIVVDEESRSGGDGPGVAVGVGRRFAPLL